MPRPRCTVRRNATGPRTEKGRKALAMLQAGKSPSEVARATWMTTTSVQGILFRWIVLPEWKALRAEVESLSAELLQLKRERRGT